MNSRSAALEPVRVSIVDDSLLIREGLAQLLAMSPRLKLLAKCADPDELLAAIATDPPDVVITDIRMPPTHTNEGMRLATRLRETHPALGVIVLSQHGNAHYAAQLLDGGAQGRGYLLKDRIDDLDHLVDTICAVAAGECRVDPVLIQSLVSRRRSRSPLDELTPRQREILADVAEGRSNLAIAELRGLTQRAVEKHVSDIFMRLGLANDETASRRVQATLLYLDARSE
jgi:DNA-binding NarL/FixJ family response regulator